MYCITRKPFPARLIAQSLNLVISSYREQCILSRHLLQKLYCAIFLSSPMTSSKYRITSSQAPPTTLTPRNMKLFRNSFPNLQIYSGNVAENIKVSLLFLDCMLGLFSSMSSSHKIWNPYPTFCLLHPRPKYCTISKLIVQCSTYFKSFSWFATIILQPSTIISFPVTKPPQAIAVF